MNSRAAEARPAGVPERPFAGEPKIELDRAARRPQGLAAYIGRITGVEKL